jgi:hypothetical protein
MRCCNIIRAHGGGGGMLKRGSRDFVGGVVVVCKWQDMTLEQERKTISRYSFAADACTHPHPDPPLRTVDDYPPTQFVARR